MRFGYEGHYMKILKGNEMVGILCFNQDHMHLQDLRAYIRHLTVNDKDLYAQVVKEAANFIFNEINADTIRVDIHHYKATEAADAKFVSSALVKDCFGMQRKGFRWKTVINAQDGARYQIMQMSRPADNQFTTKALELRKVRPKQEPIILKAAVLLSLSDKQASRTGASDLKIELPYSSISCIRAIKQNKGIETLGDLNPDSTMAQQLDKIPDTLALQGVKSQVNPDASQVTSDAQGQGISVAPDGSVSSPSEYVCSVLSSMVRLPPMMLCPQDNFSFVKIISKL